MIEMKMPRLGVSVVEGTVLAWHKQVGEKVSLGEPICDVATDKVDTEVESPADGVLHQRLVAEGDTVAVGTAIALIATDDEPAEAPPTASVPSASAPPDPASPQTGSEPGWPASESAAVPTATDVMFVGPFDHQAAAYRVATSFGKHGPPALSPLVRRLAATNQIELSAVVGTGLGGRISRMDVQAVLARPPVPVAEPPAVVSPSVLSSSGDLPAGYEGVPYEIVPTSFIRKATAEHMIRSRQTAAHMTTEVDVDLFTLSECRVTLNAGRKDRISFLPFIARVACAGLRDFPNLNATFEPERYVRWREINIGVAVDTPQGLMVPVVRNCGELTVEGIASRFVDVAQRARDKKLTNDDLRAGTFTITNPGSVGAVSSPAIINQPQVAILGLPAIVRRPWVVNLPDGQEAIAVRPILRLALTFDHRAIDGAEGTRFLVGMKDRLESWEVQDYR